jgi:hypothetical protein
VSLVLYVVLAVVVAAVLFVLAANLLASGEQIAPPLRDDPIWGLPPEIPIAATEVDAVRLPIALRGYRFAETDALLDRLATELRQRDREIAELKRVAYGPGPVAADPDDPELLPGAEAETTEIPADEPTTDADLPAPSDEPSAEVEPDVAEVPAVEEDAALEEAESQPADLAEADDAQPEEAQPDEGEVAGAPADDAEPDEAQPDEVESEEGEVVEAPADDAESEDAEPEDAEPDEAQPGKAKTNAPAARKARDTARRPQQRRRKGNRR